MRDVPTNFHPLGITVLVETADAASALAVAQACRGWEGPPDPLGRVLRITIGQSHGTAPIGDVTIEVQGNRLILHGDGVEAEADAATGTATCRATACWFDDMARLVEQVIDPLLLFLLTRSGRTPIHSAGFLIGDAAILLAGPSGAGKSCLALAAAGAGLTLLSDDTIYVQRHPALQIWGVPRPIHLFPEDAPPGTDGPTRLRAGKRKYAVPVDRADRALVATTVKLCVLTRGERVALEPLEPQQVVGLLPLDPGFDLLREDIEAALAALAEHGAWRLTLSTRPDEAIALLADRFGADASQ